LLGLGLEIGLGVEVGVREMSGIGGQGGTKGEQGKGSPTTCNTVSEEEKVEDPKSSQIKSSYKTAMGWSLTSTTSHERTRVLSKLIKEAPLTRPELLV
jgi:hypothetical protein